jgi:hypothetical protein
MAFSSGADKGCGVTAARAVDVRDVAERTRTRVLGYYMAAAKHPTGAFGSSVSVKSFKTGAGITHYGVTSDDPAAQSIEWGHIQWVNGHNTHEYTGGLYPFTRAFGSWPRSF